MLQAIELALLIGPLLCNVVICGMIALRKDG